MPLSTRVNSKIDEKEKQIESLGEIIEANEKKIGVSNIKLATAIADHDAANKTIIGKNSEIESIKEEEKSTKKELFQSNQQLATASANNEALKEKLETQKIEIEEMGKKFNIEFENIANKILDTKTEKFTELNKTNSDYPTSSE